MSNAIKKNYFSWICNLIHDKKHKNYKKLLNHLFNIPFHYILPMDDNRYADGIDLRYHYSYEQSVDQREMEYYFGADQCSVLEMMVALARRCENIMDDPDIGNRTPNWFWDMISNLGLITMTDDNYDETYVDEALQRFMDRKYEKNGKGGLFIVRNKKHVDMRQVEIWYQAMWYLNDFT